MSAIARLGYADSDDTATSIAESLFGEDHSSGGVSPSLAINPIANMFSRLSPVLAQCPVLEGPNSFESGLKFRPEIDQIKMETIDQLVFVGMWSPGSRIHKLIEDYVAYSQAEMIAEAQIGARSDDGNTDYGPNTGQVDWFIRSVMNQDEDTRNMLKVPCTRRIDRAFKNAFTAAGLAGRNPSLCDAMLSISGDLDGTNGVEYTVAAIVVADLIDVGGVWTIDQYQTLIGPAVDAGLIGESGLVLV